jgi:hypothetical protein
MANLFIRGMVPGEVVWIKEEAHKRGLNVAQYIHKLFMLNIRAHRLSHFYEPLANLFKELGLDDSG